MVDYENRSTTRHLMGSAGVYLIFIGMAFLMTGASYAGARFLLISGNTAREFIIGALAIFCAYRCTLMRAGLIFIIMGVILLSLVIISASITGQFGQWSALRVFGGVLLVALGISARRSSR